MAGELAALPSVTAVALGGSRAQGRERPDSDWDFAIYYRETFDPENLRRKAWQGAVSAVGGWGGGAMNGGAWLTIDGRRVDVHYRDLEDVEHWCAEATHGRFEKQELLFYCAGFPTYIVMGELALKRTLSGNLPTPEYPELLSVEASRRWHEDATASLWYASAAAKNGDPAVALANAARALIEEAHAYHASRREWVLNEKGLVRRGGLGQLALNLVDAKVHELADSINAIREEFEARS